MINQPLDKKMYTQVGRTNFGHFHFEDVKQAIQKLQSRLKEDFKETNWQYYWYGTGQDKNKIINEEIFKILEKAFQEEIGGGLL